MTHYPTKILVAVDFDDVSDRALETAFALAATSGANVCIMHAFDEATIARTHGPRSADAARRELSGLAAARTTIDGVKVTTRLDAGDPRLVIADAARVEHADLVVMGTHARAGTPREMLGSVAESVVRTSPVPVLTVRSRLPRTM